MTKATPDRNRTDRRCSHHHHHHTIIILINSKLKVCVVDEMWKCLSGVFLCLMRFNNEKKIKFEETVAFTFLQKKKEITFFACKEEEALIHHLEHKTTQKHHVFFCYCVYSWGEDESAKEADGGERCVGRDCEERRYLFPTHSPEVESN